MSAPPAIVCADLHAEPAWHGLNLVVQPGECAVVAGNGRRKFRLLQLLLGQAKRHFGRLEVLGQDPSALSDPLPNPELAEFVDVDGDGAVDLVASEGPGLISVYPNLGGAAFGAAVDLWAGASQLEALVVADVDSDGDPDAAVLDAGSGQVGVFANLGGTLSGPTLYATDCVHGLSTADVDGDGARDILVSCALPEVAGTFRILDNAGGTSFSAQRRLDVAAAPPYSTVEVADLTGDGSDDVLFLAEAGSLHLAPADGGGFGTARELEVPLAPHLAVHPVDLDSDGDLDLAFATDKLVTLDAPGGIGWYENRGFGAFEDRGVLYTGGPNGYGASGRDVTSADLDQDGDPDLVFAMFEHASDPDASLAIGDPKGEGFAFWMSSQLGSHDLDRDGLLEAVEVCMLGTDPLAFDTDLGGAGDGTEFVAGTDPLVGTDDGTDPDSDGDGLTDAVESDWLGTDPGNPDTDGDGSVDGVDPCPLDSPDDSDGDGVCDGVDTCAGFNDGADADGDGVADACDQCTGGDDRGDGDGDGIPDACDWCDGAGSDSDGDGVCDSNEVAAGTDPGNPDSDGDGIPDGAELANGTDPLDEAAACRDQDFADGEVLPNTNDWYHHTGTYQLEAFDIDADGDLDLVEMTPRLVPDIFYPDYGEVRVYENLGAGALGIGLPLWNESGTGLLIGDVNGDGVDDLIKSDAGQSVEVCSPCETFVLGSLSVKIVDGATGAESVYGSSGGHNPQLLDWDQDGWVDILLDSSTGTTLWWMRNLAGAGFDEMVQRDPLNAPPAPPAPETAFAITVYDAATIDLDQDGDGDALAVSGNRANVLVAEMQADGTFGSPILLVGGLTDADLPRAKDLDGDGDLDLIFSSGTSHQWYTNEGLGSFASPGGWAFVPSILLNGVAYDDDVLADLDGDGDLDHAFSSQSASACPAYPNAADDSCEAYEWSLTWYRNVSGTRDQDGDHLSEDTERCVTLTGPWDADTDGGTVGDGDEFLTGLDPLWAGDDVSVADTDGDGIGDSVEVWVYGSDPASSDTDGDGLSDLDEAAAGTDLTSSDTDGDGLSDSAEVGGATDPTRPDSDFDGVLDGSDPCPTDPVNDTDGDGVCDSDDVCLGGDDTVDTDGDGTPDDCDVCPGFDDAVDTDGDGVADGCDPCPGSDDTVDTDGDGVPDCVDACPGSDDGLDGDGDGVPDGCDACPSGSDVMDSDGDGVPDGCDPCTGATVDGDGDGLCDVDGGVLGTSSSNPDTDGDTVPDGSEFVLGTDPLVDERSCGVWPGLAPPAPAAPATDPGGFTYFDVDGDGDLDLYASYSGGTGLFENLGNGAFGPVQHIALEQCSLAAEPLPVDLDGDGDLDVVLRDGNAVWWVENLGGGAHAAPVDLRAGILGGQEFGNTVPIDYDMDGDIDLVSVFYSELDDWDYAYYGSFPSDVYVHENLGGGAFATFLMVSPNMMRGVAALDLDLDGDEDLVLWSAQSEQVWVYENDAVGCSTGPAGVFCDRLVLDVDASDPEFYSGLGSVTSRDFDGDGDVDLVLVHEVDPVECPAVPALECWRVSLWENTTAGGPGGIQFAAAEVPVLEVNLERYLMPGSTTVVDVRATDLDGDGLMDLVIRGAEAGVFPPEYKLWRVPTQDSLALQTWGPVERLTEEIEYLYHFAFADVDGDGDTDVAANLVGAHHWLENGSTPTDDDLDGLTNDVEVCMTGTSWHGSDTDLGGTNDGDEVLLWTDPMDPSEEGVALDADGDGLSDVAEAWWYGTDPGLADTDGDGVDDLDELLAGTDPLAP